MALKRRSFLAGGSAFAAAGWAGLRAGEASDALPEYYRSYVTGLAEKIQMLKNTPGVAAGFFFFTDPHVSANRRFSGRLIAELIRLTGLNKVFCGGDIPSAFGTKADLDAEMAQYDQFWSVPIQQAGGLLFNAKGNHDFTIRTSRTSADGWTYSSQAARDFYMTANGCRAAVTNDADPTACYYYADDAAAKIRYVVADTSDAASDDPRAYWGVKYVVGATQLAWLAETALATVPDGYSVIVIHHIPLAPITASDSEVKMFADFRRLLEAYQNRERVSLSGRDYDFSDARGTILLDLTGHHHSDRVNHFNGILHVTEACDAAYRDYIARTPFAGVLPEKKAGTVYEQTFDVIQVDPVHGLLYTTRVGGGQDRVFHVKPVSVAVGNTRAFAAEKLKGAVTWFCYDGDGAHTDSQATTPDQYWTFRRHRASVDASGTVRALAPGDVTVVALDAHLNKEIFGVKVCAEIR